VSPRKSTEEEVLSQVAESLMDKLAKEAYEVCMVSACIFANNWCIILQPLIKTLFKLKKTGWEMLSQYLCLKATSCLSVPTASRNVG
jgi:hypothetical protein